jgi:hypothetical protein
MGVTLPFTYMLIPAFIRFMNQESDPYVTSLLFDKGLIDHGDWPSLDKKQIEEWNETTDYELQRSKAAQLITYLVLRILSNSCNPSGKIRVKRLGAALANFEQMLISARGLEKKFYRDHLNHVVRVALLARVIGRRAPFNLSQGDLDKLTLACLFHDVGYPLSRISQTVKSIIKSVKGCYNIASGISDMSELTFDARLGQLLAVLSVEKKAIDDQLRELDHGLLSALELISYLKEDHIERYKDTIRAVALHSPSSGSQVNEKMLTVLILADELQDWGRPVGQDIIPKIDPFRFDNNVLESEYDTKALRNYSILRQIHGKNLNLCRIRLPKNFALKVTFAVKNFSKLRFDKFENDLQALYDTCVTMEKDLFDPCHFVKLYNSSSPSENIYYGFTIPEETKTKVFDLLQSRTLTANSPFSNHHIFINAGLCELLLVPNDLEKITAFSFRSARDCSIVLQMDSDVDSRTGHIKSMLDPKVKELAMTLLAELRFYNIGFQKIANFPTEPYPIEIGIEGFPVDDDIKKTASKVRKLKSCEFLGQLRAIRDSAFTDGLFLFEETDLIHNLPMK